MEFNIEVGDIISQLCDLEEYDTGEYRWSELRRERPDDSLNLVEVTRYLVLEEDVEDIAGLMYKTLIIYSRPADWCDDHYDDYDDAPRCGTYYWLTSTEIDDPREWKKL